SRAGARCRCAPLSGRPAPACVALRARTHSLEAISYTGGKLPPSSGRNVADSCVTLGSRDQGNARCAAARPSALGGVMAEELRVALEIGPKGKQVVAVAPDWSGLERGAKTEGAATAR